MIFGIGTDLIEVKRMKSQIDKDHGFTERVFTLKEIEYCESKKSRAQNYAGRYAAKEAFFKALGTGWRNGMSFTDIEILNDKSGKPEINLYNKTKEFCDKQQITTIHVSISHVKKMAMATVVIEK